MHTAVLLPWCLRGVWLLPWYVWLLRVLARVVRVIGVERVGTAEVCRVGAVLRISCCVVFAAVEGC